MCVAINSVDAAPDSRLSSAFLLRHLRTDPVLPLALKEFQESLFGIHAQKEGPFGRNCGWKNGEQARLAPDRSEGVSRITLADLGRQQADTTDVRIAPGRS